MPVLRKLTSDEVSEIESKTKRSSGVRKHIAAQYDEMMSDFEVGQAYEIKLDENEGKITVKSRLEAAAKRANKALEYRRGKKDTLRILVHSL